MIDLFALIINIKEGRKIADKFQMLTYNELLSSCVIFNRINEKNQKK